MSQDTIPIRKGEELDVEKVENFLRKNIADLPDGQLEINQFSFGRSNLTYELKIGDWEAVLRRPPFGPVAPRAHDMEREFIILREIHPHFPQAPKPYALGDESLLGRPFIIMERKRGIVLETELPKHIAATEAVGKSISENMVDKLVTLHGIDYTQTQLKDITKPEGFLERQVRGWIGRYERAKTEEIEGMDALMRWLSDDIPTSPEPTIVHYDFKLNNVMFNDDLSELIGVFDWEMTTVGDPLADLATSLTFWLEKDDPETIKRDSLHPLTTNPGFLTRDEFIEQYSKKSGRNVANMDYYLSFAFFKLGVISQQIYYRWYRGQTQDERFRHLNKYVHNLMQHARSIAKV